MDVGDEVESMDGGGGAVVGVGGGIGVGVGAEANESSSDSEGIPDYLAAEADDGIIRGRPVWMVKYLIAKAKYRWILGEHTLLLSEHDRLQREQLLLQEKKNAMLDQVLAASFGERASM